MTTNEIIQILIDGETVVVPDNQKDEVRKRLREIKKNCTIVLSQFKNF